MKRTLSIILTLTMIIGVLPTVTLAATRLDFVGITGLDAPVADVTPDYSVSHNLSVKLDSGNNSYVYYKNGICWYDLTTSSLISTTTKFVEGHQYKAVLYLKATESYSFANNIEVTVNNMPATVTDYFDQTSIVAEIVFDPIPSVTSVTGAYFYTARTPVAGDLIQEVTLVYVDGKTDFGDILDNWDGAWYVNDTKTSVPADYELYNGTKFIPNVAFAYRVEITLDEGYKFKNDASVKLNTTSREIGGVLLELSNDGKTAIYYFFLDPLTAQPINSVSYTLNGYEYGLAINQLTINSADPVSTSGSYGTDWFVTISNRVPIMTGNFNYDATYTLYIKLRSETHDVSGLTKYNVRVNGKQVAAIEQYAGEYFAIIYLPTLSEPIKEIASVHLIADVDYPTVGADFFFPYLFAVNGDENMTSAVRLAEQGEYNGWYESDYFTFGAYYEYVPAPAKFKNGKAYSYYFELYANDGYAFADDIAALISSPGGLWEIEIVAKDSDLICCEFYHNLGAPTSLPMAQNVKVTLDGYSYGKPITDISVGVKINGNAAHYKEFENMYGKSYAILDEHHQFIESGNFEYDKQYYLSVLVADPGYDFSLLTKQNVTLGSMVADEMVQPNAMVRMVTFKLPKLTEDQPAPCISGHSFTTYKSDNNATCCKNATETAKCDNCIATDTREIANSKATHNYENYVSNNDATCCKDATATAKCVWCDVTDSKVVENSALGHTDTSKIFTDIKAGKWYADAVDYAYTHGFIAGVSETEFGRDVPVTRGMFITILARIAGVDTGKEANKTSTKFTDVKSGKYYTAAIKWASENGVVNGISETTFEPDTAIERQQLCVMIVNFAKHQNITLTEVETAIDFVDKTTIAKYAKDAVAICQKADIVNGYANGDGFDFKPKNTATRAESAQILYKFHKDFVSK